MLFIAGHHLSTANVKALYRKAVAVLTMSEPEQAQAIFEQILAVDSINKVRYSYNWLR